MLKRNSITKSNLEIVSFKVWLIYLLLRSNVNSKLALVNLIFCKTHKAFATPCGAAHCNTEEHSRLPADRRDSSRDICVTLSPSPCTSVAFCLLYPHRGGRNDEIFPRVGLWYSVTLKKFLIWLHFTLSERYSIDLICTKILLC